MNTKNTASQPNVASIGDDARFHDLVADYVKSRELASKSAHAAAYKELTSYLDSKLRAPADQAASVAVEGFQMVALPIDPTEAMVQAGIDSGKSKPFSYASCFRAMLAAAPQQSLAPAADCPACNGHGLIGGCFGQTPESYEEVSIACEECDGTGKVAAEGQVSAAAPALSVWYGAMPESNGKSNFTAILNRKDAKGFDVFGGFTIARSEYPERVRYEADCVRYLIGEIEKEPFILDYDADKHSGYIAPDRASEGQAQTSAANMVDCLKCEGRGRYALMSDGLCIDGRCTQCNGAGKVVAAQSADKPEGDHE